ATLFKLSPNFQFLLCSKAQDKKFFAAFAVADISASWFRQLLECRLFPAAYIGQPICNAQGASVRSRSYQILSGIESIQNYFFLHHSTICISPKDFSFGNRSQAELIFQNIFFQTVSA